MAKIQTRKMAKIKKLKPSEFQCWRFDIACGALTVYVKDKKDLTLERALWIVKKAEKSLLES